MKGRITFFGFTFFSLLLGLVFICLDSYAAVPPPQRSTIYNSGPRDDYVPGDLILKLKPGVTLHVLLATSPFVLNK
ncbi:MAG: hypothetical protein QGI86_01915 [Candidatus Poribacteria bacterium]|jgi:hypothetical protein|nr:hypothetical protein [Candidatus Poribacteria bacterium]MDP6747043.1 hypothetical protein [Candidatus Poribacteria bacterium]MDP6997445.1 hypothetical protein [Candidatus Poribacteria bacterium]